LEKQGDVKSAEAISAPDGQIVRTIAREVNAISVLIQKYANLL
jgi:hypothetical protein